MKDQLQEVVEMFTLTEIQKVYEVVTLLAQKYLRDINYDCNPLSNEESEAFHSMAAKLLWIMKRAWPNLEITVKFLCNRLFSSDEDGWKKLRRVIAYVKGTIDSVRIIEEYNFTVSDNITYPRD